MWKILASHLQTKRKDFVFLPDRIPFLVSWTKAQVQGFIVEINLTIDGKLVGELLRRQKWNYVNTEMVYTWIC